MSDAANRESRGDAVQTARSNNAGNLAWLVRITAVAIWAIAGFAIVRCSLDVGPFRWAATPYVSWVLSTSWLILGGAVWRWCPRASAIVRKLLGIRPEPDRDGEKDRTSTFATLAAFALAQSGALTAVAKGEGRDALVLTIYFGIVAFSYAWTSQVLSSGHCDPVPKNRLDSTSIQYGHFTLSWILLLGCLMFTLGMFELLPNQKARQKYLKTEPIGCTTVSASRYATFESGHTLSVEDSQLRFWIDWAARGGQSIEDCCSGVADCKCEVLWCESDSFIGNWRSLIAGVNFRPQSGVTPRRIVAFLQSRASPAEGPVYRQLQVLEENDKHFLILENPNEGERVVLLCVVDTVGKNVEGISFRDVVWLSPNDNVLDR